MQPGLLVLHAEGAGRFQRGTGYGGHDSIAAKDSERERFDRDYRRGADAARRHRGNCSGGAIRVQVPVGAADYEWDAAGPQGGNPIGSNGIGGELGRVGGGSDQSAFKTGGFAESDGESRVCEG